MDWKTRKEKLQVNGSSAHATDQSVAARPFPPPTSESTLPEESSGPDWGVPADLARLAEASTSLDEADQVPTRSTPTRPTNNPPVEPPVSLDPFAPYRPEGEMPADPAAPSYPNAPAFQFQSIGQFTPPASTDVTEPSTIFSGHPKHGSQPVAPPEPGMQSPFTTPLEPEEAPRQFGSKREAVASGLVSNDDEFGIPRVAPFIVNMPDAPEPVDVIATDRVLILKVRNLSATYPLTNSVTTMGRPDKETQSYPDIEIELDDSVSRKHAEVRRKGGDYFLIDLGSTNGTMLNGQSLRPGIEIRLQHSDRIRLGERTELVFE